jgi:cytoskeletal protein CcmA (bactofilin family)
MGNISVDVVEIKPSGKISGTVESKELVIEPKGLFEGNSIIKGSSTQAASKQTPTKQEKHSA